MTNQYLEEKVFELEKRVEKIELSKIISDLPSINEPCDDAISRDFLFRVLDNFCGHDRTATITLDTLADIVYELPSVTQKSGKWIKSLIYENIYNCSKCGSAGYDTFKYCPNCGCHSVDGI